MNHEFHPCPKPIILTEQQAAAEMAAQHEACEREHAAALARAAEQARAVADEGADNEFLPETVRGTSEAGGGAPSDSPDLAVADEPRVPLHHPADGPPPPLWEEPGRTWRSIDFTPPRRALFLHHLAEQGNVRAAAARVGVSPSSAYLARRRDSVFRAGWDAALVHSREHALQVLANQALEGVREEVWHRGELVGHRVRHDARLLLAHIGRLDARCEDEDDVVQSRAERFDELLALVAGEDYAWALRDQAEGVTRPEWDEILPITRERHADRAAALAESELRWAIQFGCDDDEDEEPEEEEPGPVECAGLAAREAAEAEWDDWGARVEAVNAALEAGAEPMIAAEPVAADEAEDADDDEGEAPLEVKAANGIAPRLRRRKGGWLASAGGAGSVAEMGADFFARTPCGPSTCSAGVSGGATPGGA